MGLTEREERNLGWPFFAHQLDCEVECCNCGGNNEEPEEIDDRPDQQRTI